MDAFALLVQAVRESLARTGAPKRILLGLSGGADSTALLRALCALREKGVILSAVHVNHGLRTAAAEDEAFCRALCDQQDVPLHVLRVEVSPHGSTEAAAREARYAAFYDAMQKTGAQTLALAHHMDDQAETVLLHLLYGAGAAGLSGMAEYRAPLWRPLLSLRRAEIQDALRQVGQPWREDESNGDIAFTRNLIRARILPVMEGAFPQAVPAISRAGEILQAENDYLDQQAAEFIAHHASLGRWPFVMAQPLAEQHIAIQRRILRACAVRLELTLDRRQTDELCTLCRRSPGAEMNLPRGWHALSTQTRLHFIPSERERYGWPASCLEVQEHTRTMGDGKRSQAVPADLWPSAVLRTRQPGDTIRPFGMKGHMKLKDFMNARGLDRPFRDDWPLLCIDQEVLWVIGVGASERLRINGSKPHCLITFSGALPDQIQEGKA